MVSCLPAELVWTETYNFPGSTWSPGEKVTFTPDTTFLLHGAGEAVVSLRYASDAPVETLPLVVEMECPGAWENDGGFKADTITVRLLPSEARTANNAKLGVYETECSVPLGVAPAPGWSATIHPICAEAVTGLYSVTLELINRKTD